MNRRTTFVFIAGAVLAAAAAVFGGGRWVWQRVRELHGGANRGHHRP